MGLTERPSKVVNSREEMDEKNTTKKTQKRSKVGKLHHFCNITSIMREKNVGVEVVGEMDWIVQ